MVRKPPTRSTIATVIALLVGFIAWTSLTWEWAPLAALDRRTPAPSLALASPTAQIAAAFALLTWPGLQYAALAGVAVWAARRRLRQLSVALLLVVGLGWGGASLAKLAFRRLPPAHTLDLITTPGYSYPSGHMVSVVASTIAIGATFAVTRQSPRARLAWAVGAGALVLAVGVDRWLVGAHFVTDVVGGALLGGFVASFALVLAGVKVPVALELVTDLVRKPPTLAAHEVKRCAVIYNPSKVTDWATFRRHVEYEIRSRGWQRTLWLETTVDDPGRAMAAQAIEQQVDLVLGAGGDGTIRTLCAALAGSGIPFGLIPAGTGNLLAKNLGIPLDEAAALDVAFDGLDKPIDLVRLTVDGERSDRFAVMAGIGIDAAIMQTTNKDLKKAVGSAAYFVAAAQSAKHPALTAVIKVDDRPAVRRRAHVIVVGNVGYLQANIPLIPDAKPDDGLLDVLVASPRSLRDWVRLTTGVLTRRGGEDAQLDRLTGRRVRISVDRPDAYQMDGDTVGECSSLLAEIEPGALILRVPRPLLPAAR